jgi:hypothetical protein
MEGRKCVLHDENQERPKAMEGISKIMKQVIGLICSGALTATSAVADRKTLATKTLDRQLPREGELVLLGIDGTVIAREIKLAPHLGTTVFVHGSITRTLAFTKARTAHSDVLQNRLARRNRRYQPWYRANNLDC